MTRALFYFIIIFLSFTFFFSCEKSDDDNDKEKPHIELLFISDTLYVDSSYISSNNEGTIRGGNIVEFICSDNSALSSYKIHMSPAANMENPELVNKDSLAFSDVIKQSQKQDIFGKQIDTVKQSVYIPATFSKFNNETNLYDTYKIRTGHYAVWLVCADKSGNKDSVYAKNIILRYPPRYYKVDTTQVIPDKAF